MRISDWSSDVCSSDLLPVAGDDEVDKAKLIWLLDELGFDGTDAGGLDESWRQQPGTPVYATDLDAKGVRKALAEASPERSEERRVGEECVRTCRSRWAPYPYKQKQNTKIYLTA